LSSGDARQCRHGFVDGKRLPVYLLVIILVCLRIPVNVITESGNVITES